MQFFPELTPQLSSHSVSDLVRKARELLERNFPLLWVGGEISNLTRAASGHCTFPQGQQRAGALRHVPQQEPVPGLGT